jgi:hypothetical protein
MPYGKIHIVSPGSLFSEQYPGSSNLDYILGDVDSLLSDDPDHQTIRPTIGQWSPIKRSPVFREGLYVVETSMPDRDVFLKFNPQDIEVGGYEIKPKPQGSMENGRITNVRKIAENSVIPLESELTHYPHRFAITTLSSGQRANQRRVWLIGLDEFLRRMG